MKQENYPLQNNYHNYKNIFLHYQHNLIVIPLFIIFSICFYIAKLLMPFIATTMLNGFVAIRGLLTFAVNLLTSFIIIDMV